jgi:Rieske Fe-S protein
MDRSAGNPAHPVSRRAAVTGLAALTGGAVAACQTYGGDQPSKTSQPPPAATPGGAPVAKTTDIPIGGGTVFKDKQVVITQPTAGTFKGFSAVCTHQGCTVGEVADGTINCPCHGSTFAVADASVRSGPATTPLPERAIKVSGGEISLG